MLIASLLADGLLLQAAPPETGEGLTAAEVLKLLPVLLFVFLVPIAAIYAFVLLNLAGKKGAWLEIANSYVHDGSFPERMIGLSRVTVRRESDVHARDTFKRCVAVGADERYVHFRPRRSARFFLVPFKVPWNDLEVVDQTVDFGMISVDSVRLRLFRTPDLSLVLPRKEWNRLAEKWPEQASRAG